jgi:hypothetical protein
VEIPLLPPHQPPPRPPLLPLQTSEKKDVRFHRRTPNQIPHILEVLRSVVRSNNRRRWGGFLLLRRRRCSSKESDRVHRRGREGVREGLHRLYLKEGVEREEKSESCESNEATSSNFKTTTFCSRLFSSSSVFPSRLFLSASFAMHGDVLSLSLVLPQRGRRRQRETAREKKKEHCVGENRTNSPPPFSSTIRTIPKTHPHKPL